MKKILIVLLSVMFALGASAQHRSSHHHVYRSRVVVVPSLSYGIGYGYPYFNPYFGSPYFGYPYGYPNPFYQERRMPYKLTLQINAIREDYRNKIKNTRRDNTLSHADKKNTIRSLKQERDQEIVNAEKDFSRPGGTNDHRGTQYFNNDNS